MFLPSLLGHCSQLFHLVWQSPRAADVLASEYFRSKKYIGSRERRFISETTFASLRAKSAFEFCAESAFHSLPEEITAQIFPNESKPKKKSNDGKNLIYYHELGIVSVACLLGGKIGAFNPQIALESGLGVDLSAENAVEVLVLESFAKQTGLSEEIAKIWADCVLETWEKLVEDMNFVLSQKKYDEISDLEIEKLAIRFCIQPWMLKTWAEKYDSITMSCEIANSLIPSAPLCVRVNTMLTSRERVREILAERGVIAANGLLSPSALVIGKRTDLLQTDLYKGGEIEIQDEASQLFAYALNPQKTWRILDACAGAGGKTLHCAVLQSDKGKIISADVEYNRLKEIPFRARRAGLRSIEIYPLGKQQTSSQLSDKLSRFQDDCSAVIVDAPCSGLGTVRRMPMAKWRLTSEIIAKHQRKQIAVLETYSECVEENGILMYATCSIMPQENEEVIRQFLNRHPDFELEPLAPVFTENGITMPTLDKNAGILTLTPFENGTDGFFIARMRRKFEEL